MSESACKGSGDVAGSEFYDTQNVSYGVVQGRDIPIPKDSLPQVSPPNLLKWRNVYLLPRQCRVSC